MKYRFGSKEWAAAAHGVFAQRASCLASQGIIDRVSLCEVYNNTPPEFGWEDNRLAWSCVYENGLVDFQLHERDDVSFKAVGEYSAFIELSTYVIERSPEREAAYYKLAMSKVEAGLIQVPIGTGFKEPGNLESLHDILARLAE